MSDTPPTLRQRAVSLLRMCWTWLCFILACALARTTPSEMRRLRRLRELTGRLTPTDR